MSKEEPNLSACLQNLEIEVPKTTRRSLGNDDKKPIINPFLHRRRSKSLTNINLFGPHIKRTIFFKKRNKLKNKILREPVLKFISVKESSDVVLTKNANKTELFGQSLSAQDFKSIVSGCEQLSLSVPNEYTSQSFRDAQRSNASSSNSDNGEQLPIMRSSSSATMNTSTATCSLQARMSLTPPCDVTIDELASYFETFVHIPKKMSSMAEMMYI